MLSIDQCKKILGDKASKLSDEQIELIRDELYVLTNMAFNHRLKSSSPAKGDESLSSSASKELASTPTLAVQRPTGR